MIEERRKLEQDIRDGKIFDNMPTMGRGRGVAMTLPAWMTEVSNVKKNSTLGEISVVLYHIRESKLFVWRETAS